MALTITPEILNQEATAAATYCYLYEPLRVSISESVTTAQQIFIELEIIETKDSTNVVENLVEYGVYDLNPGQPLSIDLMKLAQQHHDANLYQFSSIVDISGTQAGMNSIISKYKYNFKITSDETTAATSIVKLPIIGGRDFSNFEARVQTTQDLSELEIENINLNGMFPGWPYLYQSLVDPTLQDASPKVDKVLSPTVAGQYPACAGQLIWKSRYGGWSTWGFKMKKEKTNQKYTGSIQVGMFNSTDTSGGGSPFVPVDYTGIETTYTIDLKQLHLSSSELRAAHGIMSSPAVYFMKDNSGSLELMRVAGASAPLDSKANGGDFSVTLKSISTTSQNTR